MRHFPLHRFLSNCRTQVHYWNQSLNILHRCERKPSYIVESSQISLLLFDFVYNLFDMIGFDLLTNSVRSHRFAKIPAEIRRRRRITAYSINFCVVRLTWRSRILTTGLTHSLCLLLPSYHYEKKTFLRRRQGHQRIISPMDKVDRKNSNDVISLAWTSRGTIDLNIETRFSI